MVIKLSYNLIKFLIILLFDTAFDFSPFYEFIQTSDSPMAINFYNRSVPYSIREFQDVSFFKEVILSDIMSGQSVLVLNKLRLSFIFKTLSRDIKNYNKTLHISKYGGGILSIFMLYNTQNSKNINHLMDNM